MITWHDLVETFKRVTGLPAIYQDMSFNEYANKFFGDPDGPLASEVPNGITKRQNFEKVTQSSVGQQAERRGLTLV